MPTIHTQTADSSQKSPLCRDLVSGLLRLLSEKEQEVVRRRFALDGSKKETLDKIGRKFDVTRERIRQIETVAISKLSRISIDPEMRQLHALAQQILEQNGRIMSEDLLVSAMLVELRRENEPTEANAIKLAVRISDRFVKQEKNQFHRAFWRLKDVSLSEAKALIKSAQKILAKSKIVMMPEAIAKALDNDVSAEMIQSILHIDYSFLETEDGWGLSTWRHINPKSIKDKIMVLFQKEGSPMHFSEVVNRVLSFPGSKKMVTQQAIHNELIRHSEFSLVGRGIYGLTEWGMTAGTVCDVIKTVLTENGGTLKRQEIIEKVLEKREIRLGTISLNLQKYPFFKRVGRAVYTYDASLDKRKRRKHNG